MRVGGGTASELAEVVSELGATRPVLVTDKYLVSTGAATRVADQLAASGFHTAIFDGTVPDPTTDSLHSGIELIRSHNADLVIGMGGGSPMDTAKALALLAVQGGEMRDYKAPRVNTGPALPILAIPTTAGSGSEATHFTVITDTETDEKMLCMGAAFLPIAAIVDFELAISMPPRLTADTGIDALAHAVESYVSRKNNPFASGLALQAMSTIGKNLRTVYTDGSDRPAREAMMLAATQAGIAMTNSSVTLVHGMSRPIGGHFHIAHGLSNAMLFPAVTEFSAPGALNRYAECARAIGCASGADSDDKAVGKLVDELKQLNVDLDVPTPASYGIDEDTWMGRLPLMTAQALASGSPNNNPVVPSAEQIEKLYAQIFKDAAS